jgi:hypothetical protein
VGVLLGVMVGVGVILGILEGVGVGPVAVGNGPMRAWEVSAMDVRVLFALTKRSRPEREDWIKPTRYDPVVRSTNKKQASRICRRTGLSFQRIFTGVFLLSQNFPASTEGLLVPGSKVAMSG